MDFLQIFTNKYLLVPAFAWLVAQILKTIITAIMTNKISFSRLVGDGGMPSGHSATVMSLAMMCGLFEGFGSVEFGVSMILAIIVMHDALRLPESIYIFKNNHPKHLLGKRLSKLF